MLPEIPIEQWETALEECAGQILAEADLESPPVDALSLASRLGMVVVEDRRMDSRARFVRLACFGEQGTIFIGPEPRRERRHWAIAHEIGEAFAHRVFATLGVQPADAPPSAREQVANSLAGRLLLPGSWFTSDARACAYDLYELKRLYVTASHELIARRMLELSPPVIFTVFDGKQITWRRSNLPGRPPCLSPAETSLWRACRREGRLQHQHDEAYTLHCWPVHEDGWKREILRTEVHEAF